MADSRGTSRTGSAPVGRVQLPAAACVTGQARTLDLQHHNININTNTTNTMDALMTPPDHARCRELAHPDIVNFSVSV